MTTCKMLLKSKSYTTGTCALLTEKFASSAQRSTMADATKSPRAERAICFHGCFSPNRLTARKVFFRRARSLVFRWQDGDVEDVAIVLDLWVTAL